MAKKLYLLKVSSTKPLSTLISMLNENNVEVLAVRQVDGNSTTSPATKQAMGTQMSEKGKQVVADVLKARKAKHNERVFYALAPILRSNPYSTVDRVLVEFNKTGIRTWQNTAFNIRSITKHINMALDRMTDPQAASPQANLPSGVSNTKSGNE